MPRAPKASEGDPEPAPVEGTVTFWKGRDPVAEIVDFLASEFLPSGTFHFEPLAFDPDNRSGLSISTPRETGREPRCVGRAGNQLIAWPAEKHGFLFLQSRHLANER